MRVEPISFHWSTTTVAGLGALLAGLIAILAGALDALAVAALVALAALGVLAGLRHFIGAHAASRPKLLGPEAALATFAGSMADGLALTGPDDALIYANSAFWSLLGQAPRRAACQLDIAALLPGYREAVYRLARAVDEGRGWDEVIELPGRGGNAEQGRWLRISVASSLEAGGRRLIAWRVSDITLDQSHRLNDERPAARNPDELDALPAGLLRTDGEGRVTELNTTLTDWLGLQGEKCTHQALGLADLLSPDSHAAVTHALATSDPAGVITQDVEILRRDGARFPARLLARRGQDAPTLAPGLLLSQAPSDRPDDAGLAAEARFTRLFHAAPIAIATVDSEGTIGSGNLAFARMFFHGATGAAVAGRNVLERITGDSKVAVRQALANTNRQAPQPKPIDISLGVDGRQTGQLYLSTITGGGGEREAVILYAIDTTGQKELEAQFAQSQKMQAIGQLAGGIAHDINNVLTVIIGNADLLLANSTGDPAFHDLSEIKANANRAANLVRQLLAFSRRQTLRPEILSLNEVISEMTIFLKRSLGEKVRLERDYGRDLWLVKADQTELGRVLVNLAVNATDAMPEGGTLTLRTANVPREEIIKLNERGLEPGDYVLCSVSDTGHGMAPEVLAKIFEPFFTTKEVGKGTGLGLSTVYGIVKQTGGFVYCDSAPGKGTTFRLYLPRHAAPVEAADHAARSERKERARDLTGTGTVLLVEDEDSVRRFAARALRRQGYDVLEAGNGVEALEVVGKHSGPLDIVVSDIVMPEMDGPTLLKELRRSSPDLLFVFMSGYADDALATLKSDEEFMFLAKPFQLTELVATVKEALSR